MNTFMEGLYLGFDNFGNTYAVFNCLTSLYSDFRSDYISVLAQTPEAASISETPYFNEIAHPFQIYVVGPNIVTSLVGTPEVLEAFARLREVNILLPAEVQPEMPSANNIQFFDDVYTPSANTEVDKTSESLLSENTANPHTPRPFSFRRYWDKIDLYGPVFAILAVTIFGLVMVLRMPTPGSNAFNTKHARDGQARVWAQKLLTKLTQTNVYWQKFKSFLKKIFKVR